MDEILIRANKFSSRIMEVSFEKRIETNMPILVRPKVAKMIKKASESLPEGICLQIDGGFRSRETEKILWNNRIKKIGMAKTKKIVANPNKMFLSHTTGGAVDVSLLDDKFKEINLSAPFKKYYDEQKLYSKKISKESQKLRLILNKAMLDAGFAPHENEYWHFSYGDKRWAKYYNQKPIYSEINSTKRYNYTFIQKMFYKVARKILIYINTILKLENNY